jgi:hypothetical protein
VLSNSGAVLSGANGYALFGSYNPQPAGGIAIDPLGNAWITAGNALVKLSSSGAMLSPSNGYTGGHLSGAAGVAIDAHYIVWVANYSNNSVSAFYADGAPVTSGVGITGGGLKQPASIAIDASNNIWIADYYYLTTVVELSNSGSFLSGTTGYDNVNGVLDPSDIEIDRQGNAWITNSEYNTVTELSSTGAYVSPQYGYSGGGINFPTGVAIDGAGNAWISSSGQNYFPSLGEISSQGVFLSGANGYAAGSRANAGPLVGPSGPAIDGSGNIWIANNTGAPNALSIIDEFIGLAAPVVTPTAVAVQMNALGSRP